jgi:hypothetical protein
MVLSDLPRDPLGRRPAGHIGAAADLQAIAGDVVQIVRLFDGLNRFRFAAEPDLLAAWTAASNVIGPPKRGGPAEAGQIKPAA